MAGGAFIAMLRVGAFLLLVWLASRGSRLMGISSIVLEITTGLIMSPGIAGLLPKEYSTCHYALIEDCDTVATQNHMQFAHGGCDYDAYMKEAGFVTAITKGKVHDMTYAEHPDDHGTGDSPSPSAAPKAAPAASGPMGPAPAPKTPAPAPAPTPPHSGGHSSSSSGSSASHASSSGSSAGHSSSSGMSAGHSSSSGSSANHGSSSGSSASHASSSGSSASHASSSGSSASHGSSSGSSASHASSSGSSASHSSSSASAGHASASSSAGHSASASAGHSAAASASSGGHSASSSSASHASSSGSHGDHRRLSALSSGDHRRMTGEDMFPTSGRRLASSTKGKTKYETYQDCLKKSCQLHLSHECVLTPDFFSFAGHIGVALMIFESGMHFDFDKAKECGPMACVIAVLGTILPLIFGTIVVMVLCGTSMFPEGLSAGTSLAPTSVGIALKLLNEAKQLQKPHGQIIITAAFVDDILSLILFNVLFSLGAGEMGFMTFFPAICGVLGMCGIVVFAGLGYADSTILNLLKYAPKKKQKLSAEDELLFFIMMVMVLVFGTAFFFSGTHLWGCFMAGMCLAKLHVAHHVWVKQTKRVTTWMIRIFFSCTVAFSIPVDKLFSIDAFWKGTIMGIGPCIMTKVGCAFFMGDQKWVIGWAMVGRAEFAYLIAQLAASSDMMGPEVFSVVIWSLLYATVFAPFLFRSVLSSFVKKQAIKDAGGEFTAEQEEQWQREHSNLDFRQSGHLPDLHALDQEAKREEAAEQQAHLVAHGSSSDGMKGAASLKPVQSEFEEEHHNDQFEKPYSAPLPQNFGHPSDQYTAVKDTLDTGAADKGRGSGFLCCLFFRKIVIM